METLGTGPASVGSLLTRSCISFWVNSLVQLFHCLCSLYLLDTAVPSASIHVYSSNSSLLLSVMLLLFTPSVMLLLFTAIAMLLLFYSQVPLTLFSLMWFFLLYLDCQQRVCWFQSLPGLKYV